MAHKCKQHCFLPSQQHSPSLMGLAKIESTFCTAEEKHTLMALYFVFAQHHYLSTHHPAAWMPEWARNWKRTQKGQMDIPYHITSCSAIKIDGGRRSWEGLEIQGSCCLKTGWTSAYLWEVVSNGICRTCCSFFFFLHLLNCLYSDLSFLILLFLFLPLPWEEAWAAEWVFGC